MTAPRSAAQGSVTTQERTMFPKTRRSTLPVVRPIPESAPTDTCVVDSGRAKKLADVTRMPMAR